MISFVVPGPVVPWARAGSNGGRRFTPSRQKNYMTAVAVYARQAMRGKQLFDGPVELTVVAVYEWPKSWTAKRRAEPGATWKTSVPDADNIGKILSDSLNSLVWKDDAQVARLHISKVYEQTAELRVTISPLAPA